MQNDLLDKTVAIVNDRLDANRFEVPFFKVAQSRSKALEVA
jgi:hypothetical protein